MKSSFLFTIIMMMMIIENWSDLCQMRQYPFSHDKSIGTTDFTKEALIKRKSDVPESYGAFSRDRANLGRCSHEICS
jgi:hypothetical protein